MPKYYVEVWANVYRERIIVEVEQDHEPTDDDMESIFADEISNLVESGYFLSTKERYEDWDKNG